MTPHTPDSLTVAIWNANSITNKLDDLEVFLRDHQVDLALISESHLRTHQASPNIPGYRFFRRDRGTSTRGGGVGIFARSQLDCQEIGNPELRSIEACSTIVVTSFGRIRVTAAYKPPNKRLETADLEELLEHNSPVLLGGDLNCKHRSWHSVSNNRDGRTLRHFADRHDTAVHAPSEPTHFPRQGGRPDVLDACLVRNLNATLELFSVNELDSDHNPVLVFVNGSSPSQPSFTTHHTAWPVFAELLEEKVHTPDSIPNEQSYEREVSKFTNDIKAAIQAATTTRQRPRAPFRLPRELEELRAERRRARRDWQRHQDPYSRSMMHRAARKLRTALAAHKEQQWQHSLEELEANGAALWSVVKSLRSKRPPHYPPIHGRRGRVAYTDEDKAEDFADNLELQCSNSCIHTDEQHITAVNREVRRFINSNTDDATPTHDLTTADEVRDILQNLDLKKSSGADGITNRALQNLGCKATDHLVCLINTGLKLHYVPKPWKHADVVVIPKSAQNLSFPDSYRPISLLSCTGKIFEKILLRRLQTFVEAEDVIPEEQHGFRSHHGTYHQLLRVVEHATYGFNWNLSTGALLLDISKAFDKVWHKGLIYKMLARRFPVHLTKTVQSYLWDRSFCVKLGNTRSSVKMIRAGVPQGSLISPLLFNIYTSDLPKTPGTTLCLYADDTAILARAKQLHQVTYKLQQAATDLEEWFTKWRFVVNGAKSKALLMSRRHINTSGDITLFSEKVPWVTEAKYLGAILDRRLNWAAHIKHLRDRAATSKALLQPILNRRSRLTTSCKVQIFKTVIRPILTYAAPVFAYGISRASLHSLQVIQNITLRQATDAPWYIRNSTIQRDLQVESLATFILRLTEEFLLSAKQHTNSSIRNAVDYNIEEADRHPRPLCALNMTVEDGYLVLQSLEG